MVYLTRDEFVDALQKGQGRAVLQIKEHGVGGYQDEILHACVHNLVYDAQCEPSRDEWLLSIIGLAGNADWYRERIIAALPQATETRDVSQLMHLAVHFARKGCIQARQAIYARFDQYAQLDQQEFDSTLGGEQIVALDGVAGMLHVAEIAGGWLRTHPDDWESEYLLQQAHKRCGSEAVMTAIEERAGASANVRAYLDRVADGKEQRKRLGRTPRSVPTVTKILADIDAVGVQFQYPGRFMTFGRKAGAKDLELIFGRLMVETRRDQLLRCLSVFRRRAFPQLHPRLFELAQSDDESLQWSAIAALANIQDAAIRTLAVRLLRENPAAITREAINLFVRNYEPGDHQFIESALFIPEDQSKTHGIGFSIIDLADCQPSPELRKCLEWVYEHTPCSNCRGKGLKLLIERGQASEVLLTESLWDCCEETRSLAANELNHRD